MSDNNHNPFLLNMDFSKTVCLKTDEQISSNTLVEGVTRRYLERSAENTGHTTSFVTFSPNANHPQHIHTQGEEILVLEGVFSDEKGDYPARTYIRNPPGSYHTTFSKKGCKLFVKSEQFQEGDNQRLVIKPEDQQWRQGIGGLKILSLHEFGTESSAFVAWPKNEVFQSHSHFGGEEIVVISGTFIDEHGEYPEGTWIRSPHLSKHFPRVEEETLIYVKVGHL
jgi:anti-sigma factor ChrR (cupin superfamily)